MKRTPQEHSARAALGKPMNLGRVLRVLFGLLLALIGTVLLVGGVWLTTLGGSAYYLVAGALLSLSGALLVLDKPLGFHLYAAAFVFTAVWSLWEVGLSPWALLPRLAGPCLLMAIALVVAPGLGIANGTRVRSYGFAALAVFLVGLVGAVVTTNRQGIPAALPAQADTLYDDPANVPPKGEWAFYGAGRSAQRFSDLTQITPDNVKSLRTAWTYHTGDIPAKYVLN